MDLENMLFDMDYVELLHTCTFLACHILQMKEDGVKELWLWSAILNVVM